MATTTGDLRWQETHEEHLQELNELLEKIPGLIDSEELHQDVDRIEAHLGDIGAKEARAFDLVRQGKKEEAWELLSGWSYTQEKIALDESAENLADNLDGYVDQHIQRVEGITYALILVVVVSLVGLGVSWFFSIKVWQQNYQKRLEKEREITYLSYHDSLTGLYNRRFFEEEFHRLNVERMLPLTLVIGDVDDLKGVNDHYGHKSGDLLLMEVARILKSAVREEDIVTRWGGDEFGIILPQTGPEDAEKVVQRIKEGCQASEFQPKPPRVSLGYAVKTEVEETLDNVFARAENRMYQRKC